MPREPTSSVGRAFPEKASNSERHASGVSAVAPSAVARARRAASSAAGSGQFGGGAAAMKVAKVDGAPQ